MRSVARLRPAQSFQVIVFRVKPGASDTEPTFETFDRGMVRATEGAKQSLAAWLAAIEPVGRSEPIDGLEPAFKLDPDLIFLLTRSIRRSGSGEWGAGRQATLDRLEELNPPNPRTGLRPVVIKAIQFIEEDPTGLLPALAARHGDGPEAYRVLELDQLTR